MKNLIKMTTSAVLASVLFCSVAKAEVATVYVKNSTEYLLRVFVDSQYQGTVEPGATRFCVREGISRIDGKTYGGWAGRGTVPVMLVFLGEKWPVKVESTEVSARESRVAAGDLKPNDHEVAHAEQMRYR